MVVSCGCGSFNYFVSANLSLFACLAAFLGDEVSYSLAVDNESLEFVGCLDAVGHCEVHELVGQGHEAGVLSHEVSFAVEGKNSGEVAVVA